MARVLLTGGAGYIGSHTALVLLEHGHDVVVLDSLVNASEECLVRVGELAGRDVPLVRGDVADTVLLPELLSSHGVDVVVHLAGLKAVADSVREPLSYYSNNVGGTLALLRAMDAVGVRRIVFSSSATVYGDPLRVPTAEGEPVDATNPYGRTKEGIEDILFDTGAADPRWGIAILRYFNPGGAHTSGRIGEDPAGQPSNLMPFLAQVAVGRRPELVINGDDYDTPDGTCVRDYVHVMDLAEGHRHAVERVLATTGVGAWNLGSGQGSSVRQVLAAFERVVGHRVPHRVGPRRPGDVAASCADPSRAREELGWVATRSLAQMCTDHWRWQQRNPDGYRSDPTSPQLPRGRASGRGQ